MKTFISLYNQPMTTLSNISSNLSREDFAKLNLWFHTHNRNNKVDITKKTEEEIAKMLLSQDRDINNFVYDFHEIRKFLEEKGLSCTHMTRLALAEELGLSNYEIGRMEYAS